MRRSLPTALFLLAASQLLACSHVTSSTAGPNNMTGEAWYVRTSWFLGLPVSTSVFHCPAPSRSGPVLCKEAAMRDVEESEEHLMNQRPDPPAKKTVIYTGDKKVEPEAEPKPDEVEEPTPKDPEPQPDETTSDEGQDAPSEEEAPPE